MLNKHPLKLENSDKAGCFQTTGCFGSCFCLSSSREGSTGSGQGGTDTVVEQFYLSFWHVLPFSLHITSVSWMPWPPRLSQGETEDLQGWGGLPRAQNQEGLGIGANPPGGPFSASLSSCPSALGSPFQIALNLSLFRGRES